ncbi:hypothetical protein TG4357_03355 [Thalassovita gelatinovora]|uniref:Uncharacterized protein n=1 Tax=Thalassovita gelatinovora TaxID=53501 RepID=A0A0P1FJ67_THAGE|nr:hypothetical protein [Thalassovita gelatinovora]QIZ81595.1 hypothetical protein HFZ77_14465 [Thalassovita gelatinovora]CUH68038.1 hypothetical protein TG4357_03355 [Thalassovita gelatinovora]SEQ28036.1 hypothetical protein SAMN04488043_104226 [Thalassovita gelatinovora]
MKTYFLSAAAIAVAASSLSAQDDCMFDTITANTIATHRQMGGWSISEMMSKLGSEPGLRDMILDAYSQPRMLTTETRQYAVDEFSNTWTVKCYQSGSILPRKD